MTLTLSKYEGCKPVCVSCEQLEFPDFTAFYSTPMPKYFIFEQDDVSLLLGTNRWLDFATRLSDGVGPASVIKVHASPHTCDESNVDIACMHAEIVISRSQGARRPCPNTGICVMSSRWQGTKLKLCMHARVSCSDHRS